MNTKHIVAIIGSPNVGKSSLFNRMIGRPKAITTPEAGSTRDRNYDLAEWGLHTFTLIDTGGYLPGEGVNFEEAIRKQINIAIEESHLILFVVDCVCGILPDDHTIATLLRKSGKPVLVVANKVDNAQRALHVPSFQALGLGTPYPISATHGTGTGDLMDAIVAQLDDQNTPSSEEEEVHLPRISFVGKPNVGKSTLVNALFNEERTIVSPEAHTTRDAVHSYYNLYNQNVIITDTAGIYRKKKESESIAFYSLIRSLKAIQHSDVCIVITSAEDGLTKQDLNILQLVDRQKKGAILAINKWDIIDKEAYSVAQYRKELAHQLGTLSYIPILFISGLKKQRIYQLMKKALEVYENRRQHISTSSLNKVIQEAITKTPPPVTKGKLIKIKYATQLPLASPTFALFANLPQYIPTAYKRYLTKQIRAAFNLEGAPVTIVCKKK